MEMQKLVWICIFQTWKLNVLTKSAVSQQNHLSKYLTLFYLITYFFLTHSAREYFEKLAFKKTNKKRNFKRLYLKSQGQFRVEINIFRKFIKFPLKQGCFLHALPTWVYGRGLCLLQPLVPLPATRWTQRVKRTQV